MDPAVWGKHLWASIHFIALAYPDLPTEQQKLDYKLFFENLYKVIPCESCGEHLQNTISNIHPLHANHLRNKDELFKWTVQLHNIVNKRLHKKTISINDAYNIYMHKSQFNIVMCGINENTVKTESVLNSNKYLILFILFITVYTLMFLMYGYYFVRRNR